MLQLLPSYKTYGSQFALKRTHERPRTNPSQEDFDVTVAHLMAAGLHFGHTRVTYHSHNLPYIFGIRHGQYIINLEQTIAQLRRAVHFLREAAMEGASILFVGTKICGSVTRDVARRCDSYYVSDRWKPGTFTNGYNVLRRFNPPVLVKVSEDAHGKRPRVENFTIHEDKRPARAKYEKLMELYREEVDKVRSKKKPKSLADGKKQQIVSETQFNRLMKTLPDPEVDEETLAQYKNAKFPPGMNAIQVEKARMILFPDEFEQYDDLPDYIRYRFQLGPVDPGADPNYDIEEDLYLTPEQIRQKKENWILRDRNSVKTDTEKIGLPHKPDIIVCLNSKENLTCLQEATMCGIPTIGIIDTDVDPRSVTYPIPGNDDSLRGIELVANVLCHAVLEGKALAEEIKKAETDMALAEARQRAKIESKIQKAWKNAADALDALA